MTNFQRITESPEKLAEFMKNIAFCLKCPNYNKCKEIDDDKCLGYCLEWLKQESE